MQALLTPESVQSLPAVKAWIRHADAALYDEDGKTPHCPLDQLIERNVVLQLGHLHTHPVVRQGLERESLCLHGWVYRFETGELLGLDEATGAFRKFGRGKVADCRSKS